jgi:predicted nucleotidyltransferase
MSCVPSKAMKPSSKSSASNIYFSLARLLAARQTTPPEVDLFFDHQKGSLGLYELMDVKQKAQEILGAKTDTMTRASLHPLLREQIEKAAQRIF